MRALLDTSILVSDTAPAAVEAAVSVASIAELHFGVLVTGDEDEQAIRTQRLGAIESTFETQNAATSRSSATSWMCASQPNLWNLTRLTD